MESSVAIIIPTLNEEKFIEGCVASIQNQTYPFELMDIMVVDGGSRDQTIKIVETLSKTWTNIRLLHNPQRIPSSAFNIGVASSIAPFIIRLDAHVQYDSRYIELCINHLKTNPQTGDVGGVCITATRGDGIVSHANKIVCQSKFGIGGAAFRVGAKAGYVDTVPFGAFPRHVIEEVGGMREDMPRAEDNEYVSRIRKAGYKIYLDPEIVCTYYARDTFKGIIRQMYANGLSIGQLFYVDKSAIGLRHFVPFVFVSSLFLSAVGALFIKPFLWLLLAILGAYSLCAICSTIVLCRKNGWKYFFILPPLFFSIHIAYGIGTIVGLFKYAKQCRIKSDEPET
jgi:glycosyltransferase involved in cell wall biosynthesis